jgi:hypothetical protein
MFILHKHVKAARAANLRVVAARYQVLPVTRIKTHFLSPIKPGVADAFG